MTMKIHFSLSRPSADPMSTRPCEGESLPPVARALTLAAERVRRTETARMTWRLPGRLSAEQRATIAALRWNAVLRTLSAA